MTLADELMGMVEVADMPDAPRRVNLIDDEDAHRAAIRYEDAAGELVGSEPAIAPFLVFGAQGEIICPKVEIDGRRFNMLRERA